MHRLDETDEILLVKKNLVAIENDRAVGSRRFSTLGDCQVIVVAPRRANIEKVGSAARLYGFRQNLFAELFTLLVQRIRSRKHDR